MSNAWKNSLCRCLFAGLLMAGWTGAASAQNLRPEFGPIAKDDFAFVHIRIADLWTGEIGTKLREDFPLPARFLHRDMERSFGIDPAELESLTSVGPTARSMPFIGFGRTGEKKADVKFDKDDFKKPESPPEIKREKKDCGDDQERPDPKDIKEFKKSKDFVFETDDRPLEPMNLIILKTTKAMDKNVVTRAALRDDPAKQGEQNGKKYVTSNRPYSRAVHFVSDQIVLIASSPAFMKRVLSRTWGGADDGPLGPALDLAMKKHALVIGANLEIPSWKDVRKEIERSWTEPWQREPAWAFLPLLETRSVSASIEVGKKSKAHATLNYANPKHAAAAADAARDALVLFRLFVLGREHHNMRRELEYTEHPLEMMVLLRMQQVLDKSLRMAKVEAKQSTVHVHAEASLDIAALSAEAKAELKALESDEKYLTARKQRQSIMNLKQIGRALHNFHDVYRALPPAAICDKKGKPLLSWRVAILPFIEQQPLYQMFKLDEPWDSEHNIKLLKHMPKVYAPIGIKTDNFGTYYQAFVGPGTIFELRPDANAMFGAKGFRLLDCFDGTSNTIGVAEAASPVPWTKPEDMKFGEKLPKVGGTQFNDGFAGMMMDGAVFFFENRIDANTLRAMITRAGGEFVDYHRFTRR